jgi:hypothetical protein
MNMHLPTRSYYYLDELAAAWQVQMRDLLDFAVCDALQCSVLVNNIRVLKSQESGSVQELCVSGLQRVVPQDLIEVIRTGVASIRQFRDEECGVLAFADDQADLELAMEHIMVAREDRTRFESKAGTVSAEKALAPANFLPRPGYYEVSFYDRTYNFGMSQASVIRKLHQAYLAGQPWCSTEDLLEGTGSSRLVDLFKRKKSPNWRDLIVSDRKGKWRLNLDPSEQLSGNRAYRRVVRMFRSMNRSATPRVPPRPTPDHP